MTRDAASATNTSGDLPLDWARSRGDKWSRGLAGLEATLAPVDEPLIDALSLDRALRIAEVGSGGGGTTLQILRHAPPGSTVHGFDISPALVAIALGRVPPDQDALAFQIADMATASAPGELYDRLVSRFGVMFFDDPPAAFANLAHWLVPGGRFAFAVWGSIDDNLWMRSVREVVSESVDVPALDPDSGPFRYARSDALLALLEAVGYHELRVQTWRGKLPIGGTLSPAEAAAFALSSFAGFSELLAPAGPSALERAHASLTERFARHVDEGAVRLEAAVHIVTGARTSS